MLRAMGDLKMFLDLRGIIDIPGGKINFEYEPEMTNVPFSSTVRIIKSPSVIGDITNRAGVLTLNAKLDAVCECVCARCLKEFQLQKNMPITAYLSEGNEDEHDTENYYIIAEKFNLDDVIITELLLDLEEVMLCSDDCAGLCQKCGKNLNIDFCDCKEDIDPRLAKLAQLL